MKRLACILILFCLAGCGTSPTPTQTATLRVSVVVQGEATLTSTMIPSVTLGAVYVCEGTPPIQLIIHQRGRVLDDDERPLNIRVTPGTSNAVVGQIPINEIFYVLDGPECVDGYNWFYIRYGTLEGWIAEGDNTSYFVEPFLTG